MKNATRLALLVGTSTLLLTGCWKAATNVVVDTGSMVETGTVVETGTTDTGALATGMNDT